MLVRRPAVDFSPNRASSVCSSSWWQQTKWKVYGVCNFFYEDGNLLFWICDRTGGIQIVYLFYNKHFLRKAKNNHKHHLVKCSVAFFRFQVTKDNKIHSVMFCILFMRCMSVTVFMYLLYHFDLV